MANRKNEPGKSSLPAMPKDLLREEVGKLTNAIQQDSVSISKDVNIFIFSLTQYEKKYHFVPEDLKDALMILRQFESLPEMHRSINFIKQHLAQSIVTAQMQLIDDPKKLLFQFESYLPIFNMMPELKDGIKVALMAKLSPENVVIFQCFAEGLPPKGKVTHYVNLIKNLSKNHHKDDARFVAEVLYEMLKTNSDLKENISPLQYLEIIEAIESSSLRKGVKHLSSMLGTKHSAEEPSIQKIYRKLLDGNIAGLNTQRNAIEALFTAVRHGMGVGQNPSEHHVENLDIPNYNPPTPPIVGETNPAFFEDIKEGGDDVNVSENKTTAAPPPPPPLVAKPKAAFLKDIEGRRDDVNVTEHKTTAAPPPPPPPPPLVAKPKAPFLGDIKKLRKDETEDKTAEMVSSAPKSIKQDVSSHKPLSFLDEIKSGTSQLKKTSVGETKKVASSQNAAFNDNPVFKKLQERREALKPEEPNSDSDSDDEWDDKPKKNP